MIERYICNGCGACATSCPKKCIEMIVDQEGFRYPAVNRNTCISCHMCESVCPICKVPIEREHPKAYMAKHMEDNIRERSSSGGVFYALASSVIQHNGVVCGAAYNKEFEVEHQIVDDLQELYKLQGAKYSQSNAYLQFSVIRHFLEENKLVLFVGTPCQVAGLHAYLNKEYSNLILVDMICHGVPSPLVWKKYLEYRQHKDAEGSKIQSINQRDKCSGWSEYRYSVNISYENNISYCTLQSKDLFMQGFVNNLYLRPSCTDCRFKGKNRYSDITLGDYWGVWIQRPEFDDDKGISLVMIHTLKGRKCWEEIVSYLHALDVDYSEALTQNPSAMKSSKAHHKRKQFFDLLEKKNFDKLISDMLLNEKKSLKNILIKLMKL